MAVTLVDARGLSCPEPVLRAKSAIEAIDRGIIEVLVDTMVSSENVTRLAKKLGCSVEVEPAGSDVKLVIRKG